MLLFSMSNLKKLSASGLGKLGAGMAATFAQRGFEVLGVDKRAKTVLICCPWEGCRKIAFPKGAKVFNPWGLLA